jgi:hypothetical protein
MRLLILWLFGVPTLVASMVIARALPDSRSQGHRFPESACVTMTTYSTTTRTTCRSPSLSNGTVPPAQLAPSS